MAVDALKELYKIISGSDHIDPDMDTNAELISLIAEAIKNDEGNILDGKKIVFCGDSYMVGYGWQMEVNDISEPLGWPKIIHEINPSCNVVNLAVSNAKITNNGVRILNQIYDINQYHSDADYVILQGGITDANNSMTLGSISEGYSISDLTVTEFCGGFEEIILRLLLNIPTCKVAYIVSPYANTTSELKPYMDKAKEICAKYSIPYIDLFERGGVNIHLNSFVTKYYKGSYPNEAYYRRTVNMIESFIKSL